MQTNKQKAIESVLKDFSSENVLKAIELAATPDIYDTEKGEWPEETGMYLIKKDNTYFPVFGYFRVAMTQFFDENTRVDNVKWTKLPKF